MIRLLLTVTLAMFAVSAMAEEPQGTTAQKAVATAYSQLGLSVQMMMDEAAAQRAEVESRLKWVLDHWVKPMETSEAK